MTPRQGDLFWVESETKRRPALVVTRDRAIPVLHWILVAPITRTIRDIPTEIRLGREDGLRDECAASLDLLQPVHRSELTERIGSLGPRHGEICRALAALADC